MLRPSVIVGMGSTNLAPIAIASLFVRAKLLVLPLDIWYSISEWPRISRRPLRALLRACFKRSSGILAISKSIENELRDDYHVVPNKCFAYKYRISEIFNPDVPRDLKKTLNPIGPIVLTVARMRPQKGLEYLVEAARTVAEKVPNVKFVIRANVRDPDPQYESRIRNLISQYHLQKNFEILKEYSAYEEVPKYMAAADVFVLSSVSEGLGIVLLEAMATGVPAIGSNVGGVPDVIKHEYNGLLVEPRDPRALAAAITRLLLDDNLRTRLSRGALSTVASVRENEFESLLAGLMFRR
jgi:glycosyltransferase involved in cell wall biosynthesis